MQKEAKVSGHSLVSSKGSNLMEGMNQELEIFKGHILLVQMISNSLV